MENQVLSISQMQELIELGIDTSKAHLWWYYDERTIPIVFSIKCNFYNSTYIPTFTLQDILEILPNWIDPYCYKIRYQKELFYHEYVNRWICSYVTSNGACIEQFGADSPLDAAFNMLKWCKQNNFI